MYRYCCIYQPLETVWFPLDFTHDPNNNRISLFLSQVSILGFGYQPRGEGQRQDGGGGQSILWNWQKALYHPRRSGPQKFCAQHDWRCITSGLGCSGKSRKYINHHEAPLKNMFRQRWVEADQKFGQADMNLLQTYWKLHYRMVKVGPMLLRCIHYIVVQHCNSDTVLSLDLCSEKKIRMYQDCFMWMYTGGP